MKSLNLIDADTLLSSRQMAKVMGVSLATLSRRRCVGEGPPFLRLSSTKVAYPLGAYRTWVAGQTTGTEAD